jgi:hypothetical protein
MNLEIKRNLEIRNSKPKLRITPKNLEIRLKHDRPDFNMFMKTP